MTQLQQQYNAICTEYVKRFCRKQDLDFDDVHWIGGTIGGVFMVADFYFDFSDIVYDINSKQPKGLILKWDWETVEHSPKIINYYSYTKGLRYEDLK